MPVLKIEVFNDSCLWGIWKIESQEFALLDTLEHFSFPEGFSKIRHPRKKLEWLSSRLLVKALMDHIGKPFYGLLNDDHGKPLLNNCPYHISLSHCGDYSVAILDKKNPVGIDIEIIKDKLRLVINKFLKESEINAVGNDLGKLCVYWCAKEVLYKIHGTRKISLKDNIQVNPFQYHLTGGTCFAILLLDDRSFTFEIRYVPVENYLIAFNMGYCNH